MRQRDRSLSMNTRIRDFRYSRLAQVAAIETEEG